MRVVDIEVMLHHFYKCTPWPIEAKSYADAHTILLEEEMIMCDKPVNQVIHGPPYMNFTYRVTEKGRIFVNALMSVPLPVQAWTMPGKE